MLGDLRRSLLCMWIFWTSIMKLRICRGTGRWRSMTRGGSWYCPGILIIALGDYFIKISRCRGPALLQLERTSPYTWGHK